MNVVAKAGALAAAWQRYNGAPPPSLAAVLYPLAQADIETQDGDAWGGANGPHNWGAVDLRAPNVSELVAIHSGALKAGMWLYSDGTWGSDHRSESVGQLHLDTHPDGTSYAMWFRAFSTDVEGAESFLGVVLSMVGDLFTNPDPSIDDYAARQYLHGYYEGRHAGARHYTQRSIPLTPPEAANVADYVAGMQRVLPGLRKALDGWQLPAAPSLPAILHPDVVANDMGEPPPEVS